MNKIFIIIILAYFILSIFLSQQGASLSKDWQDIFVNLHRGLFFTGVILFIYTGFLRVKNLGVAGLRKPLAIFSAAYCAAFTPNIILFLLLAFDTTNTDVIGDNFLLVMPFSLMFIIFIIMLFYYSKITIDKDKKLITVLKFQLLKSSILPMLIIFIGSLSSKFYISLSIASLVLVYSVLMLYSGTLVWYFLTKGLTDKS